MFDWKVTHYQYVCVCVYDQFDALDLAEFHAYSDTRYLARFN